MRKLHFVCANETEVYPFSGESFLYNSTPYLQLKAANFGSPLTFYALDGRQAVAQIHFFLQQKNNDGPVAISLPESPFGSLEYGGVTYEEMSAFLDFIINQLRSKSVDRIVIKDCIPAYRQLGHISVGRLLTDAGFRQTESLPNHHIVVDKEAIHSKVSSSKKRSIRLCQNADFIVREYPIRSFSEIYTFISACYLVKGRRLSLDKPQLEQQMKFLPESGHLFVVSDDQEMIAACIAVQVNARVLYTFYYAALETYNFYSPTTLLLHAVYQFCYAKGINILDLGTSNTDSVAHFKKHMGGQHSVKHTYDLKL